MGIPKRYRLTNFEVVHLYNEKENRIYKRIYKIFETVTLTFATFDELQGNYTKK